MTFEELKSRWDWKEIPNCPGRFILAQKETRFSPAALVDSLVEPCEFQVAGAKDPVIVVQLTDGGLISYRKQDGSYLHTLNTRVGFRRKLQQLGISLILK